MKKALILASVSIFLLMSAASSLPLSQQEANSVKSLKVWKPGDIWSIILLDHEGNIVRSLVIRITEKPANPCRDGEWKRLEVLSDSPAHDPAYKPEPAYEITHGELNIDLSINICDGYYPLHGDLTPLGIQGTHGTFGMDGGKTLGKFYGVPVVLK
jgi:hypothetical protein